MRTITRMAFALAGAAAFACGSPALAQEYPTRAVKVIVPQPPGGGFDLAARTVSEPLAQLLGQPVVVENRPGSGTLVGTEAAAKAERDGYTLLLGALANIAINPGLYKSLPYDPKRDFVPIGLAVSFPYTLVARKDLPQNSLKDLIDFARANPGKLNYASAGNGTGQHIGAAVIWHLTGVTATHIPYKGAQPAYQDLLAGRVDVFFDNSSTARPHVDGGRVKALAVSSAKRLPMHPDVPTVRETGVADFDMETWVGYFAPAGTPAPALARLRADFAKVTEMPAVAAAFEKRGATPLRLSAAETEALVARDIEKWTKLVRAAGIQAD
ncbi:MAG TPA: tripartite tricarboxylate transporter substrate binding protein [Burkholderiales bacterium]|nr:tripartite tricarboxylate transporter substrate binding protein [Burkholderiales bacterium]